MSPHQNGIAVTLEMAAPEVTAKAKRRSFSAAYLTKILVEVQAAAGSGNIREILRSERIYSSTLTGWRKELDAAIQTAFFQKRGPKPKNNPFTAENKKLRRQNRRFEEELRKAEIIIDVQKKWLCYRVVPCRRSGQRELARTVDDWALVQTPVVLGNDGQVSRFVPVEELFRGRHFDQEIVVLCVRWYLSFKLSSRELVAMMSKRGLKMAHTTILRWVQHYTSAV